MSQIQFETVPVTSLRPYARNARHHSRKQVKAIAAGMTEFGVTNPPLVDEAGEIIAGHGRLEAAKHLNLAAIPIIRISGLSEVQKKALRLADNQLGLGSAWNLELLSAELTDLATTDFDITLTGFETIEVDKLTTPSLGLRELDNPLPEPPVHPTTCSGDIWALGDHLLAVGDARHASAYRRLLGSKLADMVITDPPYNVPISGHVSGKGRLTHDEFRMASGEMSGTEFGSFLATSLALARDFSRDGSLHYVFADWRMIGRLNNRADSALVLVMQRVESGDLADHLKHGSHKFEFLVLPSIATSDEKWLLSDGRCLSRRQGQVLHKDTDNADLQAELWEQVGTHVYATQYLQCTAGTADGPRKFLWEPRGDDWTPENWSRKGGLGRVTLVSMISHLAFGHPLPDRAKWVDHPPFRSDDEWEAAAAMMVRRQTELWGKAPGSPG